MLVIVYNLAQLLINNNSQFYAETLELPAPPLDQIHNRDHYYHRIVFNCEYLLTVNCRCFHKHASLLMSSNAHYNNLKLKSIGSNF